MHTETLERDIIDDLTEIGIDSGMKFHLTHRIEEDQKGTIVHEGSFTLLFPYRKSHFDIMYELEPIIRSNRERSYERAKLAPYVLEDNIPIPGRAVGAGDTQIIHRMVYNMRGVYGSKDFFMWDRNKFLEWFCRYLCNGYRWAITGIKNLDSRRNEGGIRCTVSSAGKVLYEFTYRRKATIR